MKIINLKMNAFGPFKGYTEIDFTKLNSKGIFLLTGKTGSGKTSIFDAISYALYSEISSSNGADDKIRSDYASDDERTSIELDFEVKGIIYNIKRYPKQLIMGKRGFLVEKPQEAILTYNDKVITNIFEIKDEIEVILGLTANQFKKIVMIPQGEFMKLLLASSGEKVEIFRKIFNTYRAKMVEDEFKLMANDALNDVNEVKNEINMQFNNANICDDTKDINLRCDELLDLINNKKEVLAELQEDSTTLNLKINDMEVQYEKMKNTNNCVIEYNNAKKIIDELDLEYKDFEYKKRLIKGYSKAKMVKILEDEIEALIKKNDDIELEINNLGKVLIEKNQYKRDLDEKKALIESKNSGIEALKRDLFIKEDQLGKYNLQIGLKSQIEKLDLLINKELENKKNKKEYKLSLDKLYEENNNSIRDLQKRILAMYDKNGDKSYLEADLRALKDSKNDFDSLNEVSNNIEKYENDIKYKRLELLKSKEILAHKERIFYESQAGLLASNLVDGMPCPVCGSTNHPNKAKLPDEIVHKNDLDKLNEEKGNIEGELSSLKTSLGHYQELEYNITNKLACNKVLEYYNITADNLDEKILNIENEINNISNISLKIKEEEEKIIKLEEENKVYDDKIIKALNEIEAVEDLIKDYEVRKGIVEKELDPTLLDNHQTLVQLIEDIKSRIERHNNELDEVNNLIKDNDLEIERIKTEIKTSNETMETNNNIINQKRVVFDNAMMDYYNYDEFKASLIEDNLLKEYERYVNEFETKYNLNKMLVEKNYMYKDEAITKIDGIKDAINQKKDDLKNKLEQIGSSKKEIESLNNILIKINDLKNNSFDKIKRYELITRLSNVTNGVNSLKMTFEKYVLAIYFEEVIVIANELLGKMSDNRYELIRRDYLSKGNSLQGLDLDVYDYSTGKIRAINTLSGGEQFKASLALALGLSESIKREKSSVEMNTMFIDEGFGSLDSESIQQALDILLGIKNQGRVIGIISHIEDLKERIESMIVLEKTIDGSKVKVVE